DLAPPPTPGQAIDSAPATIAERWRNTARAWNERALDRINHKRGRLGMNPIDDVLDYVLTDHTWLAAPAAAPPPAPPPARGRRGPCPAPPHPRPPGVSDGHVGARGSHTPSRGSRSIHRKWRTSHFCRLRQHARCRRRDSSADRRCP